jgi:thiol-disulfide isomerase/thioredoxin
MRRLAPATVIALAIVACQERPAEVPPAPLVALPPATASAPVAPAAKPEPPPRRRAVSWSRPAMNGQGTCTVETNVVTVLHIFATWCEPCKKEMPALQALADKYGPDELSIVALSVDDEDSVVPAFASMLKIKYPVCWDQDHAIAQRLQPHTMPTTYVFDKSGRKSHEIQGFRDGNEETIEAHVQKLLAK